MTGPPIDSPGSPVPGPLGDPAGSPVPGPLGDPAGSLEPGPLGDPAGSLEPGPLGDPAGITPAMCGNGRTLAGPVPSPDGSALAFVAMGGGRPRVVVVPVDGGAEMVVTSDPPAAGCHSHGGGVFGWTPDSAQIAYVGTDGFLYLVSATGGPGSLVYDGGEVSSPVVSPVGGLVAFSVDDAKVMACRLCPGGGTEARTVSGGTGAGGRDPDFVRDPCWSPEGTRLAWVEWDVPDMPWDASRIVCAPVDSGGAAALLAGGPDTSVSQQRWSPDGSKLAYLCDASGWPVVWVAEADGSGARPLGDAADVEHGEPGWGPGAASFAWSPDSRTIAVAANRAGFWCLETVEVSSGTRVGSAMLGFFAGIHWGPAGITAVRSAPEVPTCVVRIGTGRVGRQATDGAADGDSLPARILARGPVGGFERKRVPRIDPVSWPAPDESGQEIYGRLYRPAAPNGDPPPLLVWVHGGPTGQMGVEFNGRMAYFLDRGWAVLVPDFRGSSGWGRGYARSLRGGWGVTDLADVAAGMRAAAASGWGAQEAMVPMGASSGGMCVLLLLALHPELCAAGIDLYGVTDLADLASRTHRFEKHYTGTMVGPLDTHLEVYRQRSPLSHAAAITAPLLVLHGNRDKVVPEDQSAALAEAIRAAGGTVEYHVYEGEGHGWSSPETVADELSRITDFLDRHVGITAIG